MSTVLSRDDVYCTCMQIALVDNINVDKGEYVNVPYCKNNRHALGASLCGREKAWLAMRLFGSWNIESSMP